MMERINKVISRMNFDCLLLSDSNAIFYLTGKRFFPGERFLGLLLCKERTPVLFVNALFAAEPIEGIKIVSYSDSSDISELLSSFIHPDERLGIDKTLPARFLIPMQERKIAKHFALGSEAVDLCRAIKDKEEQERLRHCSKINDEAMAIFKTLVYEGVSEKQVAQQIPDIYRKLGGDAFSFDPIVAFGINAADPHHMPDDTKLKYGDVVLFDVGCLYKDYCSDMTRTFFFRKGPDEKQKEIYQLVKKANEEAIRKIKAGVPLCEIDAVARGIIEKGGYGKYFTHRLGHFIGIEVHEYGDVSAAFTNPCQAGNVFSIEPGIYDPQSMGCRIEDLVLVTEDGCEVLNHYPHEIEII